jgi:diguanylate cyclase (GGDEF)-like protein
MTDTQILTLVVAAIIVNIAVLSLVVIPLLRRRLTPRAGAPRPATPAKAPSDPPATVSADRLAAVIGASPTLSAPLPRTVGTAPALDGLPVGTPEAETDEDGVPGTGTSDAIDAVRAAQDASEAGPSAAAATESHAAEDEALDADMDYLELSAARARGYAIHPEDPLVASTIDRLLGARRSETPLAPTLDARAAFEAPAVAEPQPAASARVPGVAPAAEDAGAGLPVMGAVALGEEDGYVEPTIDPETGLDSSLAWSNAITIEEARSSRYGRPVSVVIAELDGLDRLGELLGADVADRLIPPVADALRRNARAADRVARLSHARFGILLVETDEVRAINYVERVRSACDRWLEASAIALRLSIGWASPATDGDLRSTVRVAEERMYREQHRPAPWRPVANTAPPASTAPQD